MTEEKFIVIGCDDTVTLSAVLNTMNRSVFFPHNIISATRVSDLLGIVKSLDPDLIVLCFRNNQQALNDLYSFANKPGIPILCLVKKFESESLSWTKNSIVFTCPIENLQNKEQLNSRINSIFLLKSESSKKVAGNSFADTAILVNQPNSTRDLSRYVLELDQKVEVLLKIKDRIADLYPRVDDRTRTELISIVNAIKISANNSKLWDDFKLYFNQANPNFLMLLAQKYPDLTPIDLKYCCYIKMNMTNDDIRHLLGINQESVRTHKYRLKKKMVLSKEQDLRSFLQSVGQTG